MKKLLIICIALLFTATGFSQAMINMGYDTLTGFPIARKDTLKKLNLDQSLMKISESPYQVTIGANQAYLNANDTIPIASFAAGSGAAGDTAAFTTSAIYGSFYNSGNDTLLITAFQIGLQGTAPSVNTTVYYSPSLGVTGSATKLVNAGNAATNITTGTSVTSLDNRKIPPGNFVWVQTGTVTTKPTYFSLTLIGFKLKR